MKDIFLSFQTDDGEIARQTAEFLEQQGWSCWRCTSNADNIPGTTWVQTLVEALLSAHVVLVLYSGNAVRSTHVFREISMAVGAGKTVVVVCLDDTPFPPGWIYLVRTEQMLNAQKQQPPEWRAALANALRALLPSQCVLPIDSIADRRLKVRFCRALHRELFGDSRVRLLGATVRLPGIIRAHLASPQHTMQQMRALDHALAMLTEVRKTPLPVCCVPFRGSEDTLFVIWLVATAASERRATGILRRLPKMVREAIAVRSALAGDSGTLEPQVRMLPAMTWQPADGDEVLAAFFADAGREIADTGPLPHRRRSSRSLPGENGSRLLANIQMAGAGGDAAHPALALRLPRAMTIAAAEDRLRAILAER